MRVVDLRKIRPIEGVGAHDKKFAYHGGILPPWFDELKDRVKAKPGELESYRAEIERKSAEYKSSGKRMDLTLPLHERLKLNFNDLPTEEHKVRQNLRFFMLEKLGKGELDVEGIDSKLSFDDLYNHAVHNYAQGVKCRNILVSGREKTLRMLEEYPDSKIADQMTVSVNNDGVLNSFATSYVLVEMNPKRDEGGTQISGEYAFHLEVLPKDVHTIYTHGDVVGGPASNSDKVAARVNTFKHAELIANKHADRFDGDVDHSALAKELAEDEHLSQFTHEGRVELLKIAHDIVHGEYDLNPEVHKSAF